MKKINRMISKLDVPLLVCSVILFIFGLLNIVNASSQAVVLRYGTNIYYYFYRQLGILFVGFIMSLIIIGQPTKKYHKWAFVLYFIETILLVAVLFEPAYLGSKNWLHVGPISFQPSEFAKPILIIMTAILFEKFCAKLRNNKKYDRVDHFKLIGIIIFAGAIFLGLILLEKDLGTLIITFTIFAVMFIASPIQSEEKLQTIIFVGAIGLFALFVYFVASHGNILTEEQKSRLDFKNPCESYEEGGYQICNGFIAINSGGLFGVGIGNSKQVSYLPESHTDSVFAIIAEEYGLIFCTSIFILYLVVLYRILFLASVVKDIRNKYICLGIGIYIMLHIIINLGGLFGVMPLTGVPLPFLSYGGTFTLSLIACLSIVQRIAYERNTEKIKVK